MHNFCNETGYYDNETNFARHDAEMERADLAREARFELAYSTPEEDARFFALDAQLSAALGETALDRVTGQVGDLRVPPHVPFVDASPVNFGGELSTTHMLRARFGKRVA